MSPVHFLTGTCYIYIFQICYLLGHAMESGLFNVGPLKCAGHNTTQMGEGDDS